MSAEIPEAEIPPLQTVDVLALQRSVTIRPPKRSAPGISERGQARLIRQKLLEDEQEWEDRLALGITPAELKILQASVASVKAEFADLDGLSWDTPSAQQLLLHWHAQQAARERSPHASPGGGHPRGVQIRRSLSSLISSTSSSPSAEFTTREFEIQLDEVGQFDDDTNRLRPTTPLPPDDPDDDDDVQRTPLPSLFVRNVVNECTPKPYTHGGDEQQCGRDQPLDDVGSAIATPVLARPGMPKSHSAPSVHSLPGACFTADATPCAPRPVKSLPIRGSRIPKPLFRSKSLSAKEFPSTAATTDEQVFAFTAPVVNASSRTSKSVLSDSQKLNDSRANESTTTEGDEEPALMSSTATIRPRSSKGPKAATPSSMLQNPASAAPSKSKKKVDKGSKAGMRVASAPACTTRTSSTRPRKPALQTSDNFERAEVSDIASSPDVRPSGTLEPSQATCDKTGPKASCATKRDSKRDLKCAQ